MHFKKLSVKKNFWSSYKGHMTDALALTADEGRGYLR